jgi:hypothetical protein
VTEAFWVGEALAAQVLSQATAEEAATTIWAAVQPRLPSIDESVNALASHAPDAARASTTHQLREHLRRLTEAVGTNVSPGSVFQPRHVPSQPSCRAPGSLRPWRDCSCGGTARTGSTSECAVADRNRKRTGGFAGLFHSQGVKTFVLVKGSIAVRPHEATTGSGPAGFARWRLGPAPAEWRERGRTDGPRVPLRGARQGEE